MQADAEAAEGDLQDRLWRLALAHPELVDAPRACGWSFGFDLPTKHLATQFVAQRFYRGFMVYVAGERTVRFRLNTSFSPGDLDRLFAGIGAALHAMLDAAADKRGAERDAALAAYKAPVWDEAPRPELPFGVTPEAGDGFKRLRWFLSLPRGPLERACDQAIGRNDAPESKVNAALTALLGRAPTDHDGPSAILDAMLKKTEGPSDAAAWERLEELLGMAPDKLLIQALGARIVRIAPAEWPRWREQVVAIENATYEVGRRETEEELSAMVAGQGSIGLLALRRTDAGPQVVGYAFGGPVEQYEADGPRDDPMNGELNTFYSSNITVSHTARGARLGGRLKRRQLAEVRGLLDEHGRERYAFASSRNRIGLTAQMGAINKRLGGYELKRYIGNQYGDVSGRAQYLRVPLRRPSLSLTPPLEERPLDWASSIQQPLGPAPRRVFQALQRGDMTGPLATKLTLSNWTTPAMVRYVELLRELAPRGLKHAYFTSGRSELVDKGVRCLRVNRPKGQTVIGLQRQFLGTTTGAARSLTDPAGQQTPFGWFDWPLVPHPAEAGTDATLGAIMAIVNQRGPDDILGIVVEMVGERSGHTLPEGFLADLASLRKDTRIPLVAVETASSLGRGGEALFMSDTIEHRPNMMWWYAGAQLGHIFVDELHYVAKPLTLISTWDGDEISALRTREHLLAARELLAQEDADRLTKALDAAGVVEGRRGAPLWQVIDVGDDDRADEIRKKAAAEGLRLGKGLPGCIVICPPLDVEEDELTRGAAILKRSLG